VGLSVAVAGREFEQPPYSVRECSACGLLYRSTTLSAQELDDYYGLVDSSKWEYGGMWPTERAAISLLQRLPHGAKILDFGCSSGRLLSGLTRNYECYGFEINADAADRAAGRGLRMVPPDFLDNADSKSFDAVVLVDVFEHLSAPLEVLRKLRRLVGPNGLMVIATGNGDAPACRRDPAQFWYFRTVEHLCMLTHRHAKFLSHELSATLRHWEEVSHYEPNLREWFAQYVRDFAYWQFRRKTLLSRLVLPRIPVVRRARDWPVAPPYSFSKDHVIMALQLN